jgi:hypothetical protein
MVSSPVATAPCAGLDPLAGYAFGADAQDARLRRRREPTNLRATINSQRGTTMTETIDAARLPEIVRKSYMMIAVNVIWLLIPLLGIVMRLVGVDAQTVIVSVFWIMILGCGVLFFCNIYLAKNWYYSEDTAKGTPFASHLKNIDNIGFVTFFVTLIAALVFLIASVLVTNLLKKKVTVAGASIDLATVGTVLNWALELALTGALVVLGLWIFKNVTAGLARAARGEALA